MDTVDFRIGVELVMNIDSHADFADFTDFILPRMDSVNFRF